MNRILPVLLILIAIGIFFGYTNREYTGEIALLKEQIRGYDDALTASENYERRKTELTSARSALSEDRIKRLEVFLPDSVDNVQLILDLNALAERSGITLSDFDVTDAREEQNNNQPVLGSETPVETLELSVTATGNYNSFKTFLSGAELSLRPLDLIDLSIGESATGVYNYDMTFRIYWLR